MNFNDFLLYPGLFKINKVEDPTILVKGCLILHIVYSVCHTQCLIARNKFLLVSY